MAAEEAPSTSAPSAPFHLKPGTEVKVCRRAGALYGTVASDGVTGASHKYAGRVRVEFADGGSYYARPEALRALEKVECVY